MSYVRLPQKIECPDEFLLERFRRVPEFGPKVLFFSGGTALRTLSSELSNYTHNSIHLITPFDSGGSSYHLRKAFNMLAVGDFRNRVMALADTTFHGNPGVVGLFSHRLGQDAQAVLQAELDSMVAAEHPKMKKISGPLRQIIATHLRIFVEQMPADFDLRGASIGNLVLVGGFLNNNHQIDPVLYFFRKLVSVLGIVRPMTSADLHLAAELEDGSTVVGQHRITALEPTASPVRHLKLNTSLDEVSPTTLSIDEKIHSQIGEADLICYPFGSFYTSLLACLLPDGVGEAIVDASCPKIYIPNLRGDAEQRGMSVDLEVEAILTALGLQEAADEALDLVVLDESDDSYDRAVNVDQIKARGIQVVRLPIAEGDKMNNRNLVSVLLSLAK